MLHTNHFIESPCLPSYVSNVGEATMDQRRDNAPFHRYALEELVLKKKLH